MKLSGPRPCSVVDIVSKPLILKQTNTVYSLEFRERCEGFRSEVLAGTGDGNGSQEPTGTTQAWSSLDDNPPADGAAALSMAGFRDAMDSA